MKTNKLQAGDVASVRIHTDRYSVDVIAVSPSGKTATVRRRQAIRESAPEMIPGGFAGIVVRSAVWRTEPDPNGHVEKFTLRSSGEWKKAKHSTRSPGMVLTPGLDLHFVDDGF